MWNLQNIEFKNLFAHTNSKHTFNNNECTIIFGRNDSDVGQDNNGSGKSTLFEGIYIALTGESLRNIDKEIFINRNEETCEITLYMVNEVMKKTLSINRKFFRGKKASIVELTEDGYVNKQITGVSEANKRIFELIGINKDDLDKYYIISQDHRHSFFTAGDVEKKDIMNRITSADMIDPILKHLSENIKEKDSEIKELESKIEKDLNVVEFNNKKIEELQNSTEQKEIIDNYKKLIKESESELLKLNKELKDGEKKLYEKEDEYNKKYADLQESLLKKKSAKRNAEDTYDQLKRKIKNCENQLNDSITCPKCGEEFLQEVLSIDEVKKLLRQYTNDQYTVNKSIERLKKEIEDINKKIDESEELSENISSIKGNIKSGKQSIELYTNNIKKYKEAIKKEEENSVNEKLVKQLQSETEEVMTELVYATDILDEKRDDAEMLRFWQFNFGKQGFATYLANRSIKIIEGITNHFLKLFKTDINILINGFKINKDGSVKEKIDIFVSNNGLTAEPFLGKSGGERARVCLAGLLGIPKLINMASPTGGLNLLLLDEVLPGIDTSGQENIIKILENTGTTVMMITQNVTDSFNNKNSLYVVKDNDISKYVSKEEFYS